MLRMTLISVFLIGACTAATSAPGDDGDGGGGGGGGGGGDGGGGGGGDGGSSSLTVPSFLEQLITKTCAKAMSCKAQYPASGTDTFEDDWGADANECLTDDDDYINRNAIAAASVAGKVTFDPEIAVDCLADLEFPATCALFFSDWDYPDACWDALSGNVADGQACVSDFECSGDTSGCITGKCTAEP